jgi:hypothetical protein
MVDQVAIAMPGPRWKNMRGTTTIRSNERQPLAKRAGGVQYRIVLRLRRICLCVVVKRLVA